MHNDGKLSIGVITAGVDALSFTMQKSGDEADLIRKMVISGIQADRAAGNDWKTTCRHGYDGVMSKHCFIGEHKLLNFVEVKGAYSDELTREIVSTGARIKPTRLDLYVDYEGEKEAHSYYQRLRSKFEEGATCLHGEGPSKGSSFSDPGGAWSVYLATGNKDIISRSYNKALESGDTSNPLRRRHEIQLRGVRARKHFEMVRSAASTQWIARSTLVAHLLRYNIDEPWMHDTEPCPIPSRYEGSDNEKRLAWFHATACQVLKKLLAAGYSPESCFEPVMTKQLSKTLKVLNSALMCSPDTENLHLGDVEEWLKHGSLSSHGQ